MRGGRTEKKSQWEWREREKVCVQERERAIARKKRENERKRERKNKRERTSERFREREREWGEKARERAREKQNYIRLYVPCWFRRCDECGCECGNFRCVFGLIGLIVYNICIYWCHTQNNREHVHTNICTCVYSYIHTRIYGVHGR